MRRDAIEDKGLDKFSAKRYPVWARLQRRHLDRLDTTSTSTHERRFYDARRNHCQILRRTCSGLGFRKLSDRHRASLNCLYIGIALICLIERHHVTALGCMHSVSGITVALCPSFTDWSYDHRPPRACSKTLK